MPQIFVGRGGHRAAIQNHDVGGFDIRSGYQPFDAQSALDGGAVGLRGPATEVLDVIAALHYPIIRWGVRVFPNDAADGSSRFESKGRKESFTLSSGRVLSQDEIDSVFRNLKDSNQDDDPAKKARPYDFQRPDRIAKDQLRAIHLLHENFARSLASSLSAYLRAYVMVNLVSVEQLSYQEFSQGLPTPTCLVTLGMRPFDGNAVLELNPSLVFPILEMLLGGSGKANVKLNREITEIEQNILDGFFRLILHDLRTSWHGVTNIDFSIEAHETEPQMLQVLAPNEAIVAISIEVRIGENSGLMNIGMPSIIIKMLRQKFDQQWSMRKTQSTEDEQERMFRLIRPASLHIDARLEGPTLSVEDMLRLECGDVLTFDFPVDHPLDLRINNCLKFRGYVVNTGRKRAFSIHEPFVAHD